MNKIKNVIFDLGGVLIDLDFSRTTNAFRNLGFVHFEKMYSQFKVDQLFEKLEKGLVTPEVFYKVMLAVGLPHVKNENIRDAWNSLLLDFREESLNFLLELKKTHRIFLLSNTNEIHLEEVNYILQRQVDEKTLDRYFEKCYYSHLVGLRKPNEDIYQFVLADAGIVAEETLFIDDTINNTEAAEKLGFKVHLLKKGETIEALEY